MKTLEIKKQGITTHGPSQFSTEAELLSHLAYHESIKTYGEPQHTIQVLISPEIEAVVELEELFDETGASFEPAFFQMKEISPAIPAVYEEQVVPADYEVVITDISQQLEQEAVKAAKIAAGKKAREVCLQVLDLVAGENLDRVLTMEQITDMQTVFGPIQSALMGARPSLAKLLIASVEPGELVSAELKAGALALLSDY